jgi:Sulfotransferase family
MFWHSTKHVLRRVILHYHLFKNAGTTVASILQQNFRAGFASFDRDGHNSVISNDELLQYLETHPEAMAISSHHLRLPKPVHDSFQFYDIIVVRHPIARLWSTYSFYRRMDTGQDPLAAAAHARNACDFFQLLITHYPEHACNAQVNLIANRGDRIPTAADLPRATEIIKQASALGVAERFEESAVLAEHCLRLIFKGLDFSYVSQNVTDGRLTSLEEQLTQFKQKCGRDMLDELQFRNQLDLALFSVANEELARCFNRIPDHAKRLQNLRARCNTRERNAANTIVSSNHPNNFAVYATLASK